jgi:MFS family permease
MSTGTRADSALSMRPATRLFLAASAFSSLGNGLTFPVVALYLVRVRSMPLAAASVFYVAMAAAGTVISLVSGRFIDRAGPRTFVAVGVLIEAVGLCAFAAADETFLVGAGVLIGAGNGLFFTGLTSLLAALETGPTLDWVFSLRYMLINVGNSAGALFGAALVRGFGECALTPMYFANAATSAVLSLVVFMTPVRSRASSMEPSRVAPTPIRWTWHLAAIVAAHTLLVLFGFALFEAVVPFAFVGERGNSVALAHMVVATSTLAIIAGQLPINRWGSGYPKASILRWQAILWAAAALLGLAAEGRTGTALWALASSYGLLFGIGECLFAAGLQSLVVRVVKHEQLGRFNGVLSASYSGALAVGPALGFALIERGSIRLFWIAVLAAMIVTYGVWSQLVRRDDAVPS